MTNQHPLTDEMMRKIHGNRPGYSNPFDEDDMRAAYDLAIEHVDELWIDAQQEDDPNDIISRFEGNLRLLFVHKFLQSQKENS